MMRHGMGIDGLGHPLQSQLNDALRVQHGSEREDGQRQKIANDMKFKDFTIVSKSLIAQEITNLR